MEEFLGEEGKEKISPTNFCISCGETEICFKYKAQHYEEEGERERRKKVEKT